MYEMTNSLLRCFSHVHRELHFKVTVVSEDTCFATRRQLTDVLWWVGAQSRPIGCWCPLAVSSKSVVKEGAFVSREGYLSTVIDIQQLCTASGCTHPFGASSLRFARNSQQIQIQSLSVVAHTQSMILLSFNFF